MEDGFDNTIFISGFIVNTILAADWLIWVIAWGGLYLAAVVVLEPGYSKI